MNDEMARIQNEIDAEKAELADNLSELEDKAREVTDWRVQVRKRPLESVGVAVAAGVAIALLTRRGGRRAAAPHDANGNGSAPAGAWSHPVVDRVLGALVAVAATKAVELLSESLPELAEHLKHELVTESPVSDTRPAT